ncbi:hypothetical protein NC652_025461 [Populus alba x Populus x berolinensis]|nr:hypothetical protein NC652_025461 [Populus alba x Populus x berolinensis]
MLLSCQQIKSMAANRQNDSRFVSSSQGESPTVWILHLLLGAAERCSSFEIRALGCVFAEMINGRPLFRGETGIPQAPVIFRQGATFTRLMLKIVYHALYINLRKPVAETWPTSLSADLLDGLPSLVRWYVFRTTFTSAISFCSDAL